jgi:hypothetical protein
MALSFTFAQALGEFFPSRSISLSPVDSALTHVLIPQGFTSSRFRTYAKSEGGAARTTVILDFTFPAAYRTLSVAFPMTYAISQRRRKARILPSRVLKNRSTAGAQ